MKIAHFEFRLHRGNTGLLLVVLIFGYKNNKSGFSCLKFSVVAVGISVSLWINYLNIWNNWSDNGFYRSEFNRSFVDASYI